MFGLILNFNRWRPDSIKIQLLSAGLFLLLLLASSFADRRIFLLFTGNITLLGQLTHAVTGDFKTMPYASDNSSPSQLSTLAHMQLLEDWGSGNYSKIISACPDVQCTCITYPQQLSAKTAYYQKLRNYYLVLAYHANNSHFPAMETCRESFVSSNYLWYQSINATDQNMAEALWELAYLVDRDWSTDWRRGQTAYRQAGRYRDQGDKQAALRAYETASEAFAQSTHSRSEAHISWSLTAMGEIILEYGDLSLAESKFYESILNSPQNSVNSFKGLIHVWQEQKLHVEEMYRRFTEMRQNLGVADPYLTSGPAHAFLDIRESELAWQMIASAPNDVQQTFPVFLIAGELHQFNKEFDKAEIAFLSALAQVPDDEPLQVSAIASSLSRIYESQGNLERAIQQLKLAAELNPRSRSYWYRLALLYRENAEIDNALTAIERALQLDPQNPTYLSLLADLKQ